MERLYSNGDAVYSIAACLEAEDCVRFLMTNRHVRLRSCCVVVLCFWSHKRRCSCTSTAATTASGDSCATLPLESRRRSARTRRCFLPSKPRSLSGNRALPATQVRVVACRAEALSYQCGVLD
jgi:hypothetical protein